MEYKKRCTNCGRYPFCERIEKPTQEACENYIKRKLEVNVNGNNDSLR